MYYELKEYSIQSQLKKFTFIVSTFQHGIQRKQFLSHSSSQMLNE